MSLTTPKKIRILQRKLYRKAKESDAPCQCRFKIPQMCRSKIPQLGGFSVISRLGCDRGLHFWVAARGGAVAVPGLAR